MAGNLGDCMLRLLFSACLFAAAPFSSFHFLRYVHILEDLQAKVNGYECWGNLGYQIKIISLGEEG
uniref:HDC06907 n=1 Tax=Drosophila melanogaster TaxID=7227 RepID=Q6IG95_DROME|nr:TPA_inf: HDC06907 [Drosophila melanogaster]